MGWYEELQKTIGEAARQIKGSGHPVPTTASPRNGKVSFTKNAQVKMKQWGFILDPGIWLSRALRDTETTQLAYKMLVLL